MLKGPYMYRSAPASDRQQRVGRTYSNTINRSHRFGVRCSLQINRRRPPFWNCKVQSDSAIVTPAEEHAVAVTERKRCDMRWLIDIRDAESCCPRARLPHLYCATACGR